MAKFAPIKPIEEIRDKLQLSKISGQTQLLSTDLDLRELSLITRKLEPYRIEEAIVAGTVNRTIEGASTVSLTLNDRYGLIKGSGRLGRKVDIKIDGLWFRLVKVQKTGFQISLTFESREVAVLRTYNSFRSSVWGGITRARFVQILINEVKEFKIPFICPELKYSSVEKKTTRQKAQERDVGMGMWMVAINRAQLDGKPLTIKGATPNSTQLRNCDTVLQVCEDVLQGNVHKRKLMVCAMMTGIVEAQCHNKREGHGTSVGFFQQTANNGWGTEDERMDLLHSTREFLKRAVEIDKAEPKKGYGQLCQAVQQSAHPDRYGKYQSEAERLVTAFGIAGGDSTSDADIWKNNNMDELLNIGGESVVQQTGVDKYQFMRGRPKSREKLAEKEDTWTCITRLADEVKWRCFEVSGAIYFISEPRLFKSSPRGRISEDSDGVDWINYDYDIGKKNAQVTLEARLDRWMAPPGSVIEIHDSGPANGRWIVNDINRSIFDSKAQVTLKKPRPLLPEPKKSQVATLATAGAVYSKPQGFVPDAGGGAATPLVDDSPQGKALRDAVINHGNIEFTRASQSSDITFGLIKPRLLRFMYLFMEAGFNIKVTSMRTDHDLYSNSGNVSLHSSGRAVDMGNFTKGTLKNTNKAMDWIRLYKVELHIDELIGAVEEKCLGGPYDQSTLNDHKDHIHVGVLP